MHQKSRRTFLKKSALTAGLTTLGNIGLAESLESNHNPGTTLIPRQKFPREVWIASFSQEKLSADTPDSMVKSVMESLKGIEPFSPDVVCLPECFYIANTKMDGKFSVEQRISKSEEVLVLFSEFSKKTIAILSVQLTPRPDMECFTYRLL